MCHGWFKQLLIDGFFWICCQFLLLQIEPQWLSLQTHFLYFAGTSLGFLFNIITECWTTWPHAFCWLCFCPSLELGLLCPKCLCSVQSGYCPSSSLQCGALPWKGSWVGQFWEFLGPRLYQCHPDLPAAFLQLEPAQHHPSLGAVLRVACWVPYEDLLVNVGSRASSALTVPQPSPHSNPSHAGLVALRDLSHLPAFWHPQEHLASSFGGDVSNQFFGFTHNFALNEKKCKLSSTKNI